jgi:hypothetical protein
MADEKPHDARVWSACIAHDLPFLVTISVPFRPTPPVFSRPGVYSVVMTLVVVHSCCRPFSLLYPQWQRESFPQTPRYDLVTTSKWCSTIWTLSDSTRGGPTLQGGRSHHPSITWSASDSAFGSTWPKDESTDGIVKSADELVCMSREDAVPRRHDPQEYGQRHVRLTTYMYLHVR